MTAEDDHEPVLKRADFDAARARVTTNEAQDPNIFVGYAMYLPTFLWEVDPLFEARAAAAAAGKKYKDPQVIAGLDRDEIVAEFEQLLEAYQAVHGYDPGWSQTVHMLHKDCEALSRELAYTASCSDRNSAASVTYSLQDISAVCDDTGDFMRQVVDLIEDERGRHYAAAAYLDYRQTKDPEVLLEWGTQDDVERYKLVKQALQEEWDDMRIASMRAGYQKREANEAIMEEWEKQAALAAEAGKSLPPPELVESVELKGLNPITTFTPVSTPAQLSVRNGCESEIVVSQMGSDISSSPNEPKFDPVTIAPGERVTIDTTRCARVNYKGQGGSSQLQLFEEQTNIETGPDCDDFKHLPPTQ